MLQHRRIREAWLGGIAMQVYTSAPSSPTRRESAMTPMIDVVFQLLAFFILTFRIIAAEGDFSIAMPSAAPAINAVPPPVEPLYVQLSADAAGKLVDVRVNGRSLGPDMDALHGHVALVAGIGGPSNLRADVEVKLDCDPHLHYEHAMAALSAVAAYVDEDGNAAILIERVQFARRQRA
jgi:biopolymer transport protein ExbD